MGDAGHASRYERLECIGRGSYGDVYRGIDRQTGQSVAIKIIDLEDVEDSIEDVNKEIQALSGCRCQSITKYYSAVLAPGTTELMIIMELMSCSVLNLISTHSLDEACIAFILHEVLAALVYLHAEKRIHRDVKAANILLSAAGDVKISDFGVSGQLSMTVSKRNTFVGTPLWMAPEVIDSTDGYTEKADIWSLGITAYEIATGAPPHADKPATRALFIIPKSDPPQLVGPFSAELKDFVSRCLQKLPEDRPSARDLLSHPFIANAPLPASLPSIIASYARKRHPVVPSRYDHMDEYNATLPNWDFGARKTGRPGALVKGDKLAASENGRPAVAAVPDIVLRSTSAASLNANSPTAPGSTAGIAGTMKSSAQRPGGSMGSTGASPATSAPTSVVVSPTGGQAGTGGVGVSKSRDGGVVAPAPGSTNTGVSKFFSNMFVKPPTPSSPSTPSSTSSATSPPSNQTTVTSQTTRFKPETQSSLKDLQVDIPVGDEEAAGIIPVFAPRPERHRAESASALVKVLLPALGAVTVADAHGRELVQIIRDALSQLEKTAPGTSAQLLHEVVVKLSASQDQHLQPARVAASHLFGGAGEPMLKRTVPDLGPLGEFLLGKWQEEVAQDVAFHARQHA